ncbi:hypothetical protein V8E54_014815 [Elaphomyces granulatus]
MTISTEEWNGVRALVEDLYYVQKLSMERVVEIMIARDFKASSASYFRQLKIWNPDRTKQPKYHENKDLVELVRVLWHRNYSPLRMLRIIREEFGYPDFTIRALKELRRRHKILAQYGKSAEAKEQALGEAGEFILKTLKSGFSSRHGFVYTHSWLRQHSPHYISVRDTRRLLRLIDRKGVERRRLDERRRRARYMSVDGHDKLAEYGFQIYAIIDAFSRYVIDVYVGISNRTQVAIQKFFLRCVRQFGFPKLIRSDKGMETLMMCVCQLLLRREEKPDLPFHKAYIFGPSTKNQRIEAWWNTLADGLTQTWKKFFEAFVHADIFDSEVHYDIIALRFIYFKKVREDIENMVELHNIHPIRRQKSRCEYMQFGPPEENFRWPRDVRRYGTSAAQSQKLEELEEQVRCFDLELFQTQQVEELCTSILEEAGIEYDLEVMEPGLDQDHVQAYRFLREALRVWEEQPDNKLELVEPPTGAMQWVAQMQQAEQQLWEAQELNRRPEDIPDDEAVSEEEVVSGDEADEESGGGSEDECILGD